MVSIYLNYKYVEEDCVLYTVIGLDEAKSVNDHICFNNTLALHCWRNSSTANQKQEQRLCYGISDTEVWMHQSNSQHKRERVGQWDTLLWPFSYFIDYYTGPMVFKNQTETQASLRNTCQITSIYHVSSFWTILGTWWNIFRLPQVFYWLPILSVANNKAKQKKTSAGFRLGWPMPQWTSLSVMPNSDEA